MRLQGIPEFIFSPTQAHIDILKLLSGRHYDGVCKQASRNNDKMMGFLIIWEGQLQNFNKYADEGDVFRIIAKNNEIQICCKIMEMSRSYFDVDSEELSLIGDMQNTFSRALRHSNELYSTWYFEFEGGDRFSA
jgi:hypothetical protein